MEGVAKQKVFARTGNGTRDSRSKAQYAITIGVRSIADSDAGGGDGVKAFSLLVAYNLLHDIVTVFCRQEIALRFRFQK